MATAYAEAQNLVGPSGEMVTVDAGSRARIRPRSEFEQAVLDGRAFSFASVTYDPDAHDTILAIQNDNKDSDFHVQRIVASSDTASQIQVFDTSGVTMAGTAVTGVNLNRASGRIAQATAKADETGNGAQGAGYTGFLFAELLVANTAKTMEIGGAISIPYNHVIGVDLTTAATGAAVTIYGWFDE